MMKKYGLQLRVNPSQQKKQPLRRPACTPSFFENDEDGVNAEITRQATKNKVLKDIEEQHKKALEEDPSVFDYDGVYEQIQEAKIQPLVQDRKERKSKYIQTLMQKAKEREREHEIIYERKLVKERSKEDHLYSDKHKFVTSAYKKKLAEQAKWLAEERLRELHEERDDVTKKSDMSDFYFNLSNNVAFGAKATESRKPIKQDEAITTEDVTAEYNAPRSQVPQSEATTNSSIRSSKESDDAEIHMGPENNDKSPSANTEPSTTTSADKGKVVAEQRPLAQQTNGDHHHHKRSMDALAAAKERFLARKKAKEL